jgi:hypothetical protein
MNKLNTFINQNTEWGYLNTCASWSGNAFFEGTGMPFDSVEWGTGTPREVSKTITKLGENTVTSPAAIYKSK